MLDKDNRLAWTKTRVYVVIVLLTLMASTLGGVIASAFSRQDAVHQDRGDLGEIILPEGGLLFKSRAGQLVAKIGADEGGGFLIIYNTSEKPAITMGGSPYGGGGIIGVTSGGGGSVVSLAGHEEGGSVVLLNQNRGKRVVRLSADDDGGSISVNGPTGEEAVSIETNDSGTTNNGKIEVRESTSGRVIWQSPIAARGKP